MGCEWMTTAVDPETGHGHGRSAEGSGSRLQNLGDGVVHPYQYSFGRV